MATNTGSRRRALQEQRTILTFDLDFGEIVAQSGGKLVILFRLQNTRSDHVIQRLEKVLTESSPELSQGAIVVVEESRHRIRKLPIGS
jgi:predicted nuclease of predicted toxin-antitoxin system